jgi:CubicO group peptidase (beta-lactamase class C family)
MAIRRWLWSWVGVCGWLAFGCSNGAVVGGKGSTSSAASTQTQTSAAAGSVQPRDRGLDPRFFDSVPTSDPMFRYANPDPKHMDVDVLLDLLSEAESQGTDALLIAVGTTIVTEKYYVGSNTTHTIQSITKSVSSLLIGRLLETGKIPSVDAPISTWYPEWKQGAKAKVTLAQLLTHTSGLTDNEGELFRPEYPDKLAYARGKPLSNPPGTVFSYSNVGTMLLSGIIQQAASMKADTYLAQMFFDPMGITTWTWTHDSKGNVMTPGGLFLQPRDLLRLGLLGAQQGKWEGSTLIGNTWLQASSSPQSKFSPCYGYLWWLVREGCGTENREVVGTPAIDGYYADGWGGNYVVVIPSLQLVAVRTKEPMPNATADEEKRTAFPEFPFRIKGLWH